MTSDPRVDFIDPEIRRQSDSREIVRLESALNLARAELRWWRKNAPWEAKDEAKKYARRVARYK